MSRFVLEKEYFTSSHLFDEISSLNEKQKSEIAKGIPYISLHIPHAILIGGSAVVNYLKGGRSLTPDIDFLVNDVDSVKDLLAEDNIGFTELMGSSGSIGITIPEFNIDLLESNISGNSELNRLILKKYNKILFGGIEIKIIEPELLYIMKLELARDKDVSDAFALAAQKDLLDKDKILNYLELFNGKLSEYEAIRTYVSFI